eukprot:scaffold66633_cov40-Tisochrysis_lutea.AAC.1
MVQAWTPELEGKPAVHLGRIDVEGAHELLARHATPIRRGRHTQLDVIRQLRLGTEPCRLTECVLRGGQIRAQPIAQQAPCLGSADGTRTASRSRGYRLACRTPLAFDGCDDGHGGNEEEQETNGDEAEREE